MLKGWLCCLLLISLQKLNSLFILLSLLLIHSQLWTHFGKKFLSWFSVLSFAKLKRGWENIFQQEIVKFLKSGSNTTWSWKENGVEKIHKTKERMKQKRSKNKKIVNGKRNPQKEFYIRILSLPLLPRTCVCVCKCEWMRESKENILIHTGNTFSINMKLKV